MKLTIHLSKATQLLGFFLCLALLQGCAKVAVKMPAEPLFVGSYVKVPVSISSSGLNMDDLDFVIPAGPSGGEISPYKETTCFICSNSLNMQDTFTKYETPIRNNF